MALTARVKIGDKVIIDKGSITESEAIVTDSLIVTAEVTNDKGQSWWIMQSRLTVK